MKKNFLISVLSFALLPSTILAQGSANMELSGNTNLNVNDTVEVVLNIKDVKDTFDGIVGIGGDINYDSDYLECINMESINDNYLIQYNDINHRIGGIDFTLSKGIKENAKVFKYTFKALKSGNTTINFNNEELVDSDASEVKANIIPLNISINELEEVTSNNSNIEVFENNTTNEVVESKELDNNNIVESKKEEIKFTEIEEDNNYIEEDETEKNSPIVNFFVKIFESIKSFFKALN